MEQKQSAIVDEIYEKAKKGEYSGTAAIIKDIYEKSEACQLLIEAFFESMPEPIDDSVFKKVINRQIQVDEKKIQILKNQDFVTNKLNENLDEMKIFGDNLTEESFIRTLLSDEIITLKFENEFKLIFENRSDFEDIMDSTMDLYEEVTIVDNEPMIEVEVLPLKQEKLVKSKEKTYNSVAEIIKKLDTKIVGQKAAKSIVARAIFKQKSGIKNKRLLGSFLLAGESGIGKTELAKAIADLFYDGRICVISGGDFISETSATTLTGAGAGLWGYGDKNPIQQKVDEWEGKPGIILIDEFDQMHFSLMNYFYRILDEGKFTAAQKKNSFVDKNIEYVDVDLHNTMIFLTSNLGSNRRKNGFQTANNQIEAQKSLIDQIKEEGKANQIKQALFNRVKVVPMEKLTDEEKLELTKRLSKASCNKTIEDIKTMLQKITKKANDIKVKINVAQPTYKSLLKVADDNIRGVKQLLEDEIESPIIENYAQYKKDLKTGNYDLTFSVKPNQTLSIENPFNITAKLKPKTN